MTFPSANLRVAVTLEQCWHRVPGGTARAALDTVQAIRVLGGVELIGVAARHRSQPSPPWVPTIPVGMLAMPRNVLYETWHRFGWPPVERAVGSVDVIHVTGLAMPPHTVPIVVTLHDLAFLRFPQYFTRHGLRFFHAALDRIRNDADIILCSSQATADDATRAGLDGNRIQVVPLGVTPMIPTRSQIESVRRRFGLTDRYVLHLGTSEPRKNTAALLRVAPRLPRDVSVVFAGGSGWGDTVAPEKGSERRVIDVGFVTESDKWALLAGADAFCYPSFMEGFGLPVVEAMAANTPVVTSAGTSLAEVVGDAGLCVDPYDDAALAVALCRILDEPDLSVELTERGRERAAQFTWEKTARATVDAYRQAVGRQAVGA